MTTDPYEQTPDPLTPSLAEDDAPEDEPEELRRMIRVLRDPLPLSFYVDRRDLIDPHVRYAPSDAPCSQLEQNALMLYTLLPDARIERTASVIELSWGGTYGLIAVVTAEALELRLPLIQWLGPHTPLRSSRLWKRLDWPASTEELGEAVIAALKAQAARFRRCCYCRAHCAPEHMTRARNGKRTCHSCASRHEGIVY